MKLSHALDEARKRAALSTRRRIVVAYIVRSSFDSVEYYVAFSEGQSVLTWEHHGTLVRRIYPDLDNL